MSSQQLNLQIPEKMKNRLETVSEDIGLGQSEIVRRGILDQLRELEGDRNE